MPPPRDHLAPTTVQAEMTQAVQRLRAQGIDDPMPDLRRLMCHALGIASDRLALHRQDPLTPAQRDQFIRATQRRAAREPVSRILGGRWFYGRWFTVSADTLDPRPETEILVEHALSAPFQTVLDLGTGSGCILVTLLAERPGATGLGTDISPRALETAKANAATHGVAARIGLAACDWTDGVEGRFDLIVSNPPYISASEMLALEPEVADHDPRVALTDEEDGLSAYRAIATRAPQHLLPGGRLIVEIGPTQASAVSALFGKAGLENIARHPDLDGRDRVVSATMPL